MTTTAASGLGRPWASTPSCTTDDRLLVAYAPRRTGLADEATMIGALAIRWDEPASHLEALGGAGHAAIEGEEHGPLGRSVEITDAGSSAVGRHRRGLTDALPRFVKENFSGSVPHGSPHNTPETASRRGPLMTLPSPTLPHRGYSHPLIPSSFLVLAAPSSRSALLVPGGYVCTPLVLLVCLVWWRSRGGLRVLALVLALVRALVLRPSLVLRVFKADVAPLVGSDLGVMERDARAMRGEMPVCLTSLVEDPEASEVADWVCRCLTTAAGR